MNDIDRSTYLGGSDAASILGVSKWRTPLETYLRKIGESVEDESDAQRNKILRRGKILEPIIIDMAIDEYGLQVTKRSPPDAPNRYTHPQHSWMKAEIDFEFLVTPEIVEYCEGLIDPALIGTIQNGEVKSSSPFVSDQWGEDLTEEISIDYAAQSTHGLLVTDRQFCLYTVLVGSDNLLLYGVRRDDETIAGMLEREIEFWHCVQNRIPPDPSNMGDVLSLMYRMKGRPIEATPAIADTVAKLKQIKSSIKAFEADEEQLKFEIGAFLFHNLKELNASNPKVTLEDDTRLVFAGRDLLTWKQQETVRLDSKALKENDAAIWSRFAKTSSSRVMRLK